MTQHGAQPTAGHLTDRVVERVLTEGCTVAPARSFPRTTDDTMDIDSTGSQPIDADSRLATELKERYGDDSAELPSRSFRIPHSSSTRDGTGTLVVPDWILSRAAEILFKSELDLESETVTDAILTTVLKVSFSSFIGTSH